LGARLKITDKNTLRLGYATANKAPSVYHFAFMPTQLLNNLQPFDNLFTRKYEPNANLKLTQVHTIEGSLNWKIADPIELNTQVFYQTLSQGIVPISTKDGNNQVLSFINEDGKIHQTGANLSLNTSFRSFQFHVFATWQKTNFSNTTYSALSNVPQWFSGFVMNYSSFTSKINFNLSAYFLPSYTFSRQNIETKMQQQLILNAKLAYQFWKEQSIYVSIRNWKNNTQREILLGEEIVPVYLIGINIMY
jgi:outer membrane receptor protein involved in Fe transport